MLSKPQIASIRALHQKKFRKESGTFLAEGEKIIRDLLRSDYKIIAIYGVEEKLNEFGSLLDGLNVHRADEKDFDKISTLTTPPKILAVVAEPDQQGEIDYAGGLKIVLDGIKDPGNLGTIIRIADWFGIEEIICSEDTVDCYNPKVIQAAMGSVFRVKIIYTHLTKLFEDNKEEYKLPVYGTLLNGENIFSAPLSKDGYIILGNESEGISKEVIRYITKAISIPGYSKSAFGPDSLNVAIASGIVVAEFKKRST